jgi:hypothetical protein
MATEVRLKLKLKYATVEGAFSLDDLLDVMLSAVQDGQMLLFDGNSETWYNATPSYLPQLLQFNDQRGLGGNYTLQASDVGKMVVVDDEITVPDGLPDGFQCAVMNADASPVTLTIDGSHTTVIGNPQASVSANGLITLATLDTNTLIIAGQTQ